MILMLKVFSRLVDSFEIIFRQETFSALQRKSQRRISSACLFTFYRGHFLSRADDQFNVLPFHCKSTEWAGNFVVCSLELGIEAIQ